MARIERLVTEATIKFDPVTQAEAEDEAKAAWGARLEHYSGPTSPGPARAGGATPSTRAASSPDTDLMVRSALYTTVFFVLAPGSTAGLVPWLITRWHHPTGGPGPADVAGVVLIAAGGAVVVACFARFVTEGRGTPAPVAPTEQLVVGGLYRYVRNPMYVGVAWAIAGQVLLFGSAWVGAWLVAFLIAVVTFVKGYEEPRLAQQFGESYERYRRAVPGWWPRLTPYRG